MFLSQEGMEVEFKAKYIIDYITFSSNPVSAIHILESHIFHDVMWDFIQVLIMPSKLKYSYTKNRN